MKITILGCGTSSGVPTVTGHWGACDPLEPRNARTRVSILVEDKGTAVLVDTTPDFRQQALRAGIRRLDAAICTHDHADHCHGIDDLRGIAAAMRRRVPYHADAVTLASLQQRFGYIFTSQDGYPAICDPVLVDGPFQVNDMAIVPFEQKHGKRPSLGLRFGPFAYSTDISEMTEENFATLAGIEVWVVDALRYEPHPSHAHLDLTLSWIERLRPARAILTHMTWDMDYARLKAELPPGVEPAFDGMEIEI
ncbi:MBL fold metallo-hydrolase [Zavarzinia sp. CC-PAN008]|uniref:MBL fold metallo-hydrolase n=1 Tax=Zavarzinia sp. CC-PAN008 TaxID=3243332 RepID=UPI003F74529D